MDGWAIHASDCGPAGQTLAINPDPAQSQPAGPDRHLTVRPGHAIRLFTGAPLPAGTAAIVMQEDAALSAEGTALILQTETALGDFIRRAGSDLCVGQSLLRAGDLLTPTRLALAASQGHAYLTCGARPDACVLTTGSELDRKSVV